MGTLCRALDWSATRLGPIEGWSSGLTVTAGLVIGSPHAMAILWGPQYIQICNDGWRTLAGERHAGLGRPARECWPGDWEIAAPELDRVMQGGPGGMVVVKQTCLGTGRADGADLTMACSPAYGDGGRVGGVLVVLTRTNEPARARTLASQSDGELRFRTMANLVPDLIWTTSGCDAFEWYNDRWIEYTGHADPQGGSAGWRQVLHPEERASALADFELVTQGRVLRQEIRLKGADGTYRWFLVQVHPVRDARGDLAHCIGVATDIHDHRTVLEAAQSAMAALETSFETLEARVRERTADLTQLNAELATTVAERDRTGEERNALLRALASAEEEERRRISRELHDQLGQHLTGLTLGLAEISGLLPSGAPASESARVRLAQLQQLAVALTRDVRYLAVELRPPELDDVGLESALATYVEQWTRRYGVAVELQARGLAENAVPGEIATTVYRVLQEALTNVTRHAEADLVSVIVERRDGSLSLIVEDDGRGFDPEALSRQADSRPRFGLAGMRERVALVSGSLAIESTPGSGTTLYIRLPIDDSAPSTARRETGLWPFDSGDPPP